MEQQGQLESAIGYLVALKESLSVLVSLVFQMLKALADFHQARCLFCVFAAAVIVVALE